MGRAERPALRGTWLGALLRLLNPVVRLLLASPLHWPLSRWFALLTYSGRTSGRRYTTPVSYVLEGSTAYLTSGDRWTANVREPTQVNIRIAGRWRGGVAAVVGDRDESYWQHARLFRERPFFRRLAGIPATPGGDADPEQLSRSLDAGRTIVRIELD